ncbi:MAG: hypothetical protein R2817_14710 [Flavobacteriales bacterium]
MTRGELTVVVVLAAALAWDWFGSRFRLDADDLLALKPGMTKDEVRVLLGEPLQEEVRRDHKFFCRCNPEQICWRSELTTWTYTRKPLIRFVPFLTFPMVWVHFNERGHVDEVYTKQYFADGMDSKGLYLKKLDPCDPNDRAPYEMPGYDALAAAEKVKELF